MVFLGVPVVLGRGLTCAGGTVGAGGGGYTSTSSVSGESGNKK